MTIERMKLSRLGAFYRRGGALALLPLGLALVMGFLWWLVNEELRLLHTDGVDTTATVISTYETTTRGTKDSPPTTTYYVKVHFDDGREDVTRRYDAMVSEAFQHGVAEGDEIPVRYVPQDLSLVDVDPDYRDGQVYWAAQTGLLMLTWFAGMIWHYGRESAKIYRAVNHGEVREARVTGHVNASTSQLDHTRKDHEPRYMLKWDDARDEFGMGGSLKEEELVKYPKGTVIVIYTDPVSGETFWEGQI